MKKQGNQIKVEKMVRSMDHAAKNDLLSDAEMKGVLERTLEAIPDVPENQQIRANLLKTISNF